MKITMGDLKRHLASFHDDDDLVFQGELIFYRLKQRGPKLVQIEFDEAVGFLTEGFRRDNPNVRPVFVSVSGDTGGDGHGPIDVEVR